VLTLTDPISKKSVFNSVDVVYVSGGNDLLQVSKSTPAIGKSILIGNPNFMMNRKDSRLKISQPIERDDLIAEPTERSGFAQLPGTEKEVNSISVFAGINKKDFTILKGDEATEKNVKAIKNPYVLHFATHGVFSDLGNADSYIRSKLALAGAGDAESFTLQDYNQFEDGFLTAYEVIQMNLRETQLVVLSACETGLGEVQSGEGVWGLQRAFQLAGAKSVMGSLWKINDEVTAIFMGTFYKNFFSTQNPRLAYNEAIRETQKKYPHPYFWGAFVLRGSTQQ
jgi:CHAT domain-containing protein